MSQTIETVGALFDLDRHGHRLAVVTPDGTELSYRDLADRVSEVVDELGPDRRLLYVTAKNDLDSLVTYLAGLQGGHVVLLAADDSLRTVYDPEMVHDLHPDLALLLSTSGSTGSPKLVRLSMANLRANAESIAKYLDIRDTDRASATLPMHYCYGLSVINSNLLSGAGLLLSHKSVVDSEFWTEFHRHGGTSLHGVPYTFELLDELGFDQMDLPSLRYITQAGGRLEPAEVRRYANLGKQRGWRFFVMYGQTEATARMAYLPPELAVENSAAVGVPIPGGSFDLAEDGELIYRGPNVMLGYAENPADLALGRTVDALPTGDIARRDETGLYEIVGRKSRFAKMFGLRIDLRNIEKLLADNGFQAAGTASGDSLAIAIIEEDSERAHEIVHARTGLPPSSIQVVQVERFPRLPNGKIDYQAIGGMATDRSVRERTVREAFARVLGRRDIADDASFVSLGGDSLSHVRMSIELERVLGRAPHGWHTMPVKRLETLRQGRHVGGTVETDILLRALAIILIVGTHVGLFAIMGGAHVLLVIAGWSFARFTLSHDRPSGTLLRSATRIAVPSMLWITYRLFVSDNVTLANVFLVNNYLAVGSQVYWFVEVLVQTLLLLAIVFAIPGVAQFERRHRFGFAATGLCAALGLLVLLESNRLFPEWGFTTHGVLWFFMLGWLAQRATTGVRKGVVLGVSLLLIPDFLVDPVRAIVVIGGVLTLLVVQRLTVPKLLARLVAVLAGASLYVYLTHYAVYLTLLPFLPPFPVVVITLAVGIVAWRIAEWVRCGWRRSGAYTS
ncbi:AMP-binding protein [Kibdelosporangium philippinense]|uniref:AMP-binding protein n=1 Tax=Kibdelosporangium philippinense TaxID=211113 RepID=A0ABS8ZWS8_9PSEU|nr:AMP-binding protein [Kibdelosporangium philippinense]MCE7012165.1 AMP-binding protein [Kibdelosporangium philippinense]